MFDAAVDRTTNLPHVRRTLNRYTTRPRSLITVRGEVATQIWKFTRHREKFDRNGRGIVVHDPFLRKEYNNNFHLYMTVSVRSILDAPMFVNSIECNLG